MTIAPSAVWVNGERRGAEGPHVSAHDRGFTLGDGAFETMRVWNGAAFRLERHLARLERALGVLAIPVPPALGAWVVNAIAAAPADAAVRLTVSRGAGTGVGV